MTEVPAMFRNGMMPVRFMNSTMKKIVVSSGRKRRPSFLPSRSSAMLTRTKSRPISTIDWKRPGMSFMRRVPSQKTRSEREGGEKPDRSMIRLNSKATDGEQGRGEELVDRGTVEASIIGACGLDQQVHSVS